MAVNIAAMQQLPNIAGNFQQGYAFGQQQRAAQQQRADQERLRKLSPQIIAGDPGAFAEASAIDPKAAGAQMAAGDQIARRAEGLVKLLEDADARDPREAQALWQAHGVPFARQFSQGTEPTTDWQQAKPMLASLKARIAMAKSAQDPTQDPTGFREAHMKAVAAGYQPGTEEYQRAMRVSLGTEAGLARTQPKTITTDINGVPTTLTFDPGTQSYRVAEITPAGFQPPTNAPSPQNMGEDQITEFANQMLQAGIEPERVETWVRNVHAGNPGASPQFTGSPGAPAGQAPRAGIPIIGRTKEAEAAAVEAAKQAAQLQYLPESKRIERESSIEQARGIEEAKKQVEVQSKEGQRSRDAAQTLALLDAAEEILPTATGGGAGAAFDRTAGFFGQSTQGAQATARLNLIAAQLVSKVPRFEGPQSNIDVQFYREAAGDLANPNLPVETRMAALQTMRALNQKYAGRQTQEAAPGAPTPGTVQDGYRFKGGNPADPNSWERL